MLSARSLPRLTPMIPPFERSTPEQARRTGLAWAVWPADLATPVRLFLALRARGHRCALLESVEGAARLARYSFVGVDPAASFRGGPRGVALRTAGESGATPERTGGAPLEALRRAIRERPGASAAAGLPPFCGGWIGWTAYEWACALEPSVPRPASDPWGAPDLCFDLYEDVLALDHAEQKLWFLARCGGSPAEHARAQARLEALAEDALAEVTQESGGLRLIGGEESPTSAERYRQGVVALKAAIAEGEIFQAVLARRFEQRFEGDPFALYRVLRIANPSPYMFFFEAEGLALVGSSPERLVAVRGGRVETHPIAGTRPRGKDPTEDARLAGELVGDVKERAEHDMLVDLARNDLGRVARVGTVRVREHARLERFARVQHLTSKVDAELATGRDALDALAACFPAGTVSGAPKVRAMQLLAGLEGEARGPYGGAFGYLDGAGGLDTALVIRTFVVRRGVLSVQAGAGIVHDSDPEREEEETRHKASALLEAVRLAESETFSPARKTQEVSP